LNDTAQFIAMSSDSLEIYWRCSRLFIPWDGLSLRETDQHHQGKVMDIAALRSFYDFVSIGSVIPGRANWRGPGIHARDRGFGFRARALRAPE
jgi:hypothetical protein